MFATSSSFTHFKLKSVGRIFTLTRTSITVPHFKAAMVSIPVRKSGLFQLGPKTLDDGYAAMAPDMTDGMATRMKKIVDVGREGRRLIVGCDGTWVNSDEDGTIPSNVTRLCRAMRSSRRPDPPEGPKIATRKNQIIYYHRGIGTNGGLESKYLGGGTGSELSEHARECYGFLCNNWREGDEIFLFGFSRGAYTVRALSSLIADIGLLDPYGMEHFHEIYEDWKNQNVPSMQVEGPVTKGVFKGMDHRPKIPEGEYRRELLKRGLTTLDVPIKVLGVFDTVGALGIPPILGLEFSDTEFLQFSFVNTKVSQAVVHAFQALALDEHRAAFSPAIWESPDVPNNLKTLRQCWFPGVHCNIGGAGGYQDQGLANMTLAWMISQLQSIPDEDGTPGLLDFDEEYLEWVFQQNVNHVNEVDSKVGYRGWALGKIEETMSTTYSLVGQHKVWAASKSLFDWLRPGDVGRTPGEYEEVSASHGKGVKTGKMLQGTHEKVHPAARIRTACGGKGVVSNTGSEAESYVPKSLEGWQILGSGDKTDPRATGFQWQAPDGKVILDEETLGPFEEKLLAMSQQALATKGKPKG